METITHLISTYGYSVIFVAMTLGIVFLPVPEETLMIFCGFQIARCTRSAWRSRRWRGVGAG